MTETFVARLRRVKEEAGVNTKELSQRSGVSCARINYFCEGKFIPCVDQIRVLADALGTTVDYLTDCDMELKQPKVRAPKVRVWEAARCMGATERYIRAGLLTGELPFGTVTKGSNKRYTYYINPEKFRDFVGPERFDSYFGVEE